MVVQLAKILGADVYATASAAKQQLVAKLGATVINYNSQSVKTFRKDECIEKAILPSRLGYEAQEKSSVLVKM